MQLSTKVKGRYKAIQLQHVKLNHGPYIALLKMKHILWYKAVASLSTLYKMVKAALTVLWVVDTENTDVHNNYKMY